MRKLAIVNNHIQKLTENAHLDSNGYSLQIKELNTFKAFEKFKKMWPEYKWMKQNDIHLYIWDEYYEFDKISKFL